MFRSSVRLDSKEQAQCTDFIIALGVRRPTSVHFYNLPGFCRGFCTFLLIVADVCESKGSNSSQKVKISCLICNVNFIEFFEITPS